MRIGILSDTHGLFDEPLMNFFAEVDELWHAGDFGNMATADAIAAFKPLKGVYGNIDGGETRLAFRPWESFVCEGCRIAMTHVGGYPNRYERSVEAKLKIEQPNLFIAGHSHILKVVYDKNLNLLHINPGAAGASGFHQVRTAIRLTITDGKVKELEVGEWPRRRFL